MNPLEKIKNVIAAILLILLVYSCNKKEEAVAPTISNEALTTVSLIVTNTQSPFDKDTATWEQLLDWNGNPLPVDTHKAHLILKAHTTYQAQLLMLDKTQIPYFNVSDEIVARGNYHLLFYQPLPSTQPFVIPTGAGDELPLPIPSIAATMASVASNPLNITVTLTDHDSNPQNYPIGLQSNFIVGDVSKGWVRIVLRHQPNVKNGTYAPGSTDLDIGYTVTVQ